MILLDLSKRIDIYKLNN